MKRKFSSGLFIILFIGIVAGLFFEQKKIYATDDLLVYDSVITDQEDGKQIINDLQEKYNNDDVVGVLKFDNTNIVIPITQGTDNKEYLTKNIFKEQSIEGNPFLDYRVDINNSQKLLIYGHNSPDRDVPFKHLDNYYNEDYFLNHQYITLMTEKENLKFQIFSVYVETKNWDYMNLNFSDENEWYEHINKLKNNSIYDTRVAIDKKDEILILQTCSEKDDYKQFKNKYLLIISRRVN